MTLPRALIAAVRDYMPSWVSRLVGNAAKFEAAACRLSAVSGVRVEAIRRRCMLADWEASVEHLNHLYEQARAGLWPGPKLRQEMRERGEFLG